MEAAAVAWVAEITKKPFFAVKVVTDIVDGDRPTSEEFLENLASAAKSLQEVLPKIIEFVYGKE
jgi:5'-methylthioadenosine nucleosidase